MADGAIRLAVFGLTGAGKSSFVNDATGASLEVGHGADSCTKKLEAAERYVHGKRFILYDMPGNNDTDDQDVPLFIDMSKWLAQAYDTGQHLNGVIFMEPMAGVRVGRAEQQRTQMLEAIVGSGHFGRVAIVTSMWDVLAPETAKRIENNRSDGDKAVWRGLIDGGATMFRYYHTPDSALEVLRHFLPSSRFPPRPFQLQQELLEAGGVINETTAARFLEEITGGKVKDLEQRIQIVGSSQDLQNTVEKLQGWRQILRDTVVKICGFIRDHSGAIIAVGRGVAGAATIAGMTLLCQMM